MDLRGMLNDGPAASTPSKPPPQPQHPPPPPAMPSTPVQTNSYQPYRDYGHTQQSPSQPMSIDRGLQQLPPGAYASPPPYQGSSGPYPNRPAPPPPPPPLQQISPNDLRSPSIASGPGPSPYRQTPTSSISGASVGYPFPQQTPTSPVQRHQYPPPHQAAYHRDSFPQPSGPGGMTGPPGGVSYMQPQQVPQTPPVVTPGGHPSYPPHQRSQSTHSTPTPTSAQSQPGQYGAPFLQGSPVATHHNLPQMESQSRQSSQPPTPVAAPLSRPAQTMSFGQPPSPYQQRMSTTATYPHPPPLQRSPPAPLPPSLPRHSSATAIYDPLGQDSLRRSQSHVDSRDRSISVSPKTRIPSLPNSAGRPGTSVAEPDPRHAHPYPGAVTMGPEQDRDRALTPAAKRKLGDRELRPEELERREVRPPPFDNANGRSAPMKTEAASHHTSQPQQQPATFSAPRKKRKLYTSPPVWAQKLQGRRPTHANCSLYKPTPNHASQINGKPDSLPSRHTSPEDSRRAAPQHPSATQPAPAPPGPDPSMGEGSLLGQWEPSITNEIPLTDTSRAIADFLFRFVIANEDFNQIQSRGVHFEIEAKLGTLIDKHDGQQLRLPIRTECILADEGEWANRFGFKSSMSEGQHRQFNEFLNDMVKQAHQDNKERQRPRVPIRYKHRREIDKFYELPAHVRDQTLPPCVTVPMQHAAKVRVTYDQKTNEVLAKIVKVRIADINLHVPSSPLDCRISINLEMDWSGSVDDLEQMAAQSTRPAPPNRNKDRLSYNHSHYQIDLTQVTIMGQQQGGHPKKEHELEVELSPDALIDQGKRAMNGQPNQYADLVDGFLNNIRVLARKATEFAS